MHSRQVASMLALVGLALARAAIAAEPVPTRGRVLLLFEDDPEVATVNALFQTQFRAELPSVNDVEIRTEHFEGGLIASRAYRNAFWQWLSIRYAGDAPDVIVAVGAGAIGLLADPAARHWRDVPVVFGLVDDRLPELQKLEPNVTGVTDHFPVRETIDLALKLFPTTRHVGMVAGASHFDRSYAEILRWETRAYRDRLEVIDLVGLPVPELLERVRTLPADSVLIVVSYFADASGRHWSQREVIRQVAQVGTAPVFTVHAHVLGSGVVGGVMSNADETAQHVARLAGRVLAGEKPNAIPVERSGPYRTLLDGRALARWDAADQRVPREAEVHYRELPSWRRYLGFVLVFASALCIETLLIGALLIERRARRTAERRAREDLMVIAHLNRVGAIGGLAGSLAHELNTPLGAVLNNAQAARRFLAQGAGRTSDVLACLDDIVSDSCRAGEVVRRMRAVMRRESIRQVKVDVAAVIHDAALLVEAEARDRNVTLSTAVDDELPSVRGDDVQLVQVVLNLVMNAIDVLAHVPGDRRDVVVLGKRVEGGVEIRVADTGPGISPAQRERLFEPFFTTKPGGLGLGLAISRSIVEAHGGSIRAIPVPEGGAAFHVFLPAASEGVIAPGRMEATA
jgi:signal transduction histidine kinase